MQAKKSHYSISNKHKAILLLIAFFYLFNGIYSINHLSITWDEGPHFNYGVKIIKGDAEKKNAEVENSKLPITVLNTFPRIVQQIFSPRLVKHDDGVSDIIKGRYITLFFSLLTIILVCAWATKLYGVNAGLFAAFLMSLCPNNLSNAVLVTTDAYSSFFMLATMYCLWLYFNKNTTKHFIIFSLAIAASQLAKQSLLHLYIITAVCSLMYWVQSKHTFSIKIFIQHSLLFIFINWLVINAGFLFYKPFMPLGEYHFISHFFTTIQNALPAKLPVPFSNAFVTGLDMAKYYDQIGGGRTGNPESSFGNVTILGNSSTGGHFWYYYFVSFFYKTPVTVLLLMPLAIYIACKKTKASFFKNEFFLLFPIVYFFIIFNFLYNTQCGIRHIIFIYPPLFVFISPVVNFIKTNAQKVVFALLNIYLFVSVASNYKNLYAYTNEFIFDKATAYTKVGASNLYFNQCNYYLNDYLRANADIQVAPPEERKGKFIINIQDYMDIWNTHTYNWLYKYKPVGSFSNGCYLIFDIE